MRVASIFIGRTVEALASLGLGGAQVPFSSPGAGATATRD